MTASKAEKIQDCYNINYQDEHQIQSNVCFEEKFYACNNSLLNFKETKEIDSNLTNYNENDVLLVLDRINVTIYRDICVNQSREQVKKSVSKRYDYFEVKNRSCENQTCFYTNDPYLWFPNLAICSECVEKKLLIGEWIPFLLLGLICLVGNGVVIYRQLIDFLRQSNRNKEIEIYNALVLSLSVADILMGFYLVLISFEIKRKSVHPDIYFSDNKLCDALGTINLISSQVSLSMIVLISILRLGGIIRPYDRLSTRKTVSLILLAWAFWIIASLIPVLDVEALQRHFIYGLRDNEKDINQSSLFFLEHSLAFKELRNRTSDNLPLKQVLNGISSYPSHRVLAQAMRSFNMINSDKSTWSPIGFYSTQYYCTISLVVGKSSYFHSHYFTLVVVISNLLSCMIVIISYSIIYINVTDFEFRKLTCLSNQKPSTSQKESVILSKRRKLENYKLFRTITVIVFTDVVMWLGMCFTSLLYWERYDIDEGNFDHYLYVYTLFQSVMFCLMPINSVLNPFIYFYNFWKTSFKEFRMNIRVWCCKVH